MTTRRTVQVIIAVLALGVVLILLVVDKAGWQYGNVPEWFAAVGTVGALFASIWGLWRTTARVEAVRRDEERTQARLITVETEPVPTQQGVWVTVANHSSAPVFAVLVTEVSSGPMEVDFRVHQDLALPNEVSTGMLKEGGEHCVWLDAVVREGEPRAGSLASLDPIQTTSACVEFIDVQGFRWSRKGSFEPTRLINPHRSPPDHAYPFFPVGD